VKYRFARVACIWPLQKGMLEVSFTQREDLDWVGEQLKIKYPKIKYPGKLQPDVTEYVFDRFGKGREVEARLLLLRWLCDAGWEPFSVIGYPVKARMHPTSPEVYFLRLRVDDE